jgi:hypothetical protein
VRYSYYIVKRNATPTSKEDSMGAKRVITNIRVLESAYTDTVCFLVVGTEKNEAGTIHCFGTRASVKAANALVARVKLQLYEGATCTR